jgi:hypothetical protein
MINYFLLFPAPQRSQTPKRLQNACDGSARAPIRALRGSARRTLSQVVLRLDSERRLPLTLGYIATQPMSASIISSSKRERGRERGLVPVLS